MNDQTMTEIRWERDDQGIVTLTMDATGSSANTMTGQFLADLGRAVDRLQAAAADGSVTGVVLTSAKKSFFAGGDVTDMLRATPDDAPALTEHTNAIKRVLRSLETLPVPVVAAINGAALGGGLEIALACHHRVALAAPHVRIGFPEVTLGLLPGAGGVVRTVRLLGLQPALDE